MRARGRPGTSRAASRGRGRCIEHYAAAGRCFQPAGRAQAGVDVFDRCFAIFEHVLSRQTNVSFVLNHLKTWPELFVCAPLAALDLGDPRARRAVRRGRTRAPHGSLAATWTAPCGVDAPTRIPK